MRTLSMCFAVVLVAGTVSAQTLAGSFNMYAEAPDYATNPPTYSAVEACALVFGGAPENWAASVSDVTITNTAWVDGWADSQYCTTPASETFKLNSFYDCGTTGCAYSAYVSDHSACDKPTYCWQISAFGTAPADVPAVSPWGFAAVFAALAAFGVFRLRA